MAWSPRSAGDRSVQHHAFITDSGVYPLTGLTGSNLSLHLINTNVTPVTVRICTGTWTITDAANGKADFLPSVADVATPGTYKAYAVLGLSTGPKAFSPQTLEIEDLP